MAECLRRRFWSRKAALAHAALWQTKTAWVCPHCTDSLLVEGLAYLARIQ